jgi:serine/threonine-protein kinase HipA
MSIPDLKYCPGTLAEGFETYSTTCLRIVFNGRQVSHLLPFESPQHSDKVVRQFVDNIRRFSIPGVQQKLSLIQEKNLLRLTQEKEQGTHILKPIPALLGNANMVPANEHLTMQIARQIYGLNTAANALIFFQDGTPAYITRRFDVRADRSKWGREDFATLAGRAKTNSEDDYKYDFSYEELGTLIRKYVPAWRIEIEKFFSRVVFNYLFSNGDAHLKNFSLLETSGGDYALSPAYDLVNTRMHLVDNDFALSKGLFGDDFRSAAFKLYGHACREDFIEFGKRIGVTQNRIEKLISPFLEKQLAIEAFVSRSFLNDAGKRAYLLLYNTRRNLLNI